jgi:hypothetical protein
MSRTWRVDVPGRDGARPQGRSDRIDPLHFTVEFGQCGQCGHRRHTVLLEQEAVRVADAGHVDERIGGAPLRLADQLELTELAVVVRFGAGVATVPVGWPSATI